MYIMAKETIVFEVTSIENPQIDKIVIFEGDICKYNKKTQVISIIKIGKEEVDQYYVSHDFVEEYFEKDLDGFVSLLLKDNNCYDCDSSFEVIGIFGEIEDALAKAKRLNKECGYKNTFTILLEKIS